MYNSVTFQVSHTFNTEGNYTIHVNVSNDVSYESASLSVYVQESLHGFNMSHVMHYNGGVVMFTVGSSKRAEHVFFNWTFGDDSPQLNEYAYQVSDTVTYSKPHRYTPGQYTVTLICFNLISALFLSLNVSVPKRGGLTAHIENNNVRLVPNNSTINMNAIDVTEDLDGRQGNLSFVWYCRKKEGEEHVEDMPNAPIVAIPAEGMYQSQSVSLIWRLSRDDDTPSLVHICYCLSVVDVRVYSEVIQPGGSQSPSRSSSLYASNHKVNINAMQPFLTMLPWEASRLLMGFVLVLLNTS